MPTIAPPIGAGDVLLTGGDGLQDAEIYDPQAGKFFPTGSMTAARTFHTATLLNNGEVFVFGGYSLESPNLQEHPAEIYNPATGTFTASAATGVHASIGPASTLLTDGQVLVVGGRFGISTLPCPTSSSSPAPAQPVGLIPISAVSDGNARFTVRPPTRSSRSGDRGLWSTLRRC